MAQQVIDVGTSADSGNGDSLYEAGNKINNNFGDFFDLTPVKSDIKFLGNNITARLSNADIMVHPSGTGTVLFPGIRFNDNNIEVLNSNDDLKITANGSGRVTIAGLGFGGTTISSDDSSSVNINENLIVDGDFTVADGFTFSGAQTFATGTTFGTLTIANGSITDSSGAISFGNENLTTTGTLAAGDDSVIGNLTLTDGSITDSSGAISFGNENISTTGNLSAGTTTFDALTVSGATSFAAPVTVDSLSFNDNIISTSTNADLELTPGGTGVVNVSNMTIDSSINFTDNVIKVTTSNADMVLSANGTGSVVINNLDLDSGTIDNTIIGANDPSSGLFSTLNYTTLVIPNKITFSGNTVSTNRSNDNLEFAANGSGNVVINGLSLPNSDGSTGAFIKTDGSGALSFFASSIAFSESTIVDNQQTIGFSSKTIIDSNTAIGSHEQLQSDAVMLDSFDQSKYDSAWYIVLSRNKAADSAIEFQIQKHVLAQGTEDGSTFDSFSGSSQIVRSSASDKAPELASDVRSAVSKVRLLGRAGLLADSSVSTDNAVTFFRIGLGDNDSSGTQAASGLAQTLLTADLDSAAATLDSWAIADHRAAKYFISINNTTTNEVSSTEVMLIHDGTDAYVTEYNTIISNGESTPLATFTADISGGNARLRGANGTAGTCRVVMYRILLADDTSAADGTYVDVLGAKDVTNTGQTTIDTDTFRGTASPDVSSQKVISTFANTFDSVWYHATHKDITNGEFAMHKYSINQGITSDGSTQQAGITDSSILQTGAMNDINTVDVGISGSNIQLLATGVNDGSTAILNATSYFAIGVGDNTADATSGRIKTVAGVSVAGNVETKIDHVTATGNTQGSVASTRTGAEFTASEFNGALYFLVTRDIANGSFETQKVSVMHNYNDAFLTSSSVTSTDEGDTHPTFDADMVTADDSSSKIRLRMTDGDGSSVTPSNTMNYFRIGIGDDDSTGYVGELTLVNDITHVNIIDSSAVVLDSFTKTSHVGAKYFINVKNQSTGETGNLECLITHDNTTGYVISYNEFFSGNNSLITLTADVSGNTLSLRGSATAGGSTKVIVHRVVAFGDSESDDANSDSTRKVIGNVVTSSTATEFDSFQSSDTDAVHYVITGQGGTNENYICEATVVTDGTGVFVSHGPSITTKTGEIELLELSATISGGTVSVKAASTSGATAVQAFAIRLKAPTSVATTVDSFATADTRGAKYYFSVTNAASGEVSNMEALVVHNGSDAFVTVYNEHHSNTDLLDVTANIVGSNVVVTGTPFVANSTVKFYRIDLADNESDSTGTDFNTIGAVTVSSSDTAIDTFEDTSFTGAHYVIVGFNNSESSASILEATVLSNGTQAFVAEGPFVSSKGTAQLNLTAAHNGSSTVTLSASATSGSSTTVNAFRIHMLRGDATPFTELDSFSHSDSQGANYIIAMKDASNRVQMSDVMLVSDGTDAYHTELDINSESTSAPFITLTSAVDGDNVKLRAESTIENTTTVTNVWKVPLTRATGNPQSVATLDTFDKTTHRSAFYNVTISDSNAGALGNYETCELRVIHDGTDSYISVFGRTSSSGSDLVTFTTDVSGNDVRLRGSISTTNDHVVTVVRRLVNL